MWVDQFLFKQEPNFEVSQVNSITKGKPERPTEQIFKKGEFFFFLNLTTKGWELWIYHI